MPAWVPVDEKRRCIGQPPRSRGARFAALYTCRVPIINGTLLLLLPAICRWFVPTLLGNLVVMDAWSLFWCSAAAYVLAWSIQVTYRVTAVNRCERFFLPGPPEATSPGPIAKVITRVLPIPLLITIFALRAESDGNPNWIFYLAAVVGGFALAYLMAFFSVVLAATVAPPGQVIGSHFFPVSFAWQRRVLTRACRIRLLHLGPKGSRIRARQLEFRLALRAEWPNGYFDSRGRLYGGHWIAITSFALSLLLYIALGFAKSQHVPALSYVLELQFLIVWTLGGAAFLLDRYRVPLLLPIILVGLVNTLPSQLPRVWDSLPAWFPSSDHFYRIWSHQQPELASPEKVLDAFLEKTGGDAIVVATAGGGIQAAAWTTEVLTELQSSITPLPGKPRFADSIAMFSGVSGGSIGMMFFGLRYTGAQGAAFPTSGLDKIVAEAETPALNDVAWGLTNADVTRILFPYLKFGSLKLDDRGKALENAWQRASTLGDVGLSAWTEGVANAYRPAFLFNSTIAETGEPILFATSALNYTQKTPEVDQYAQRRTFFSEYPGNDLQVVTAARMSASFSYVTPAARPLRPGASNHEVDGGYYDNYGMNSLAAWLAEALDKRPRIRATASVPKPRILVLQIQSFPLEMLQKPAWKTWLYQLYAPLDALFSVRSTGQTLRDAEALRIFEEAYRSKATFYNACFIFPGVDPPLSWQLDRSQKRAVIQQWQSQVAGKDLVQKFFDGSPDITQKDCSGAYE